MENDSINRFRPLKLQNGKLLRNRVVVPPMASQTADENGFVTEKTLAHYDRLTAANPGLLMVEYTYVDLSGKSEDHQLGIQSDDHIPGLMKLAAIIKSSGAVAGIQITHSGAKTDRALTGGVLMGPSRVAVPVKDRELEVPSPMTQAQIDLWKTAFVEAADRAAQAGFDLVEFHSAHGYGLNQWLSPITNHRTDQYGYDLHGRMKLLLDIVACVRAKHPSLLLSVRMPGQDFLEGGIATGEAVEVAQALEIAAIDILNISSGIGGWRRPSPRIGEGYLVNEAAMIQANVQIPVIGVGGIETGAYIDKALSERKFSLAAVGRAILSDPQNWAQTHLNKELQERIPFQSFQRGWELSAQRKGKICLT
jgi:NADPH2 dehydrogenase